MRVLKKKKAKAKAKVVKAVPPPSRRLLLQTLFRAGACDFYTHKFREEFGASVTITEKLCRRIADSWNFGWAAGHLLKQRDNRDKWLTVHYEDPGRTQKLAALFARLYISEKRK